ncbi:MAG: hypothetical protein KatS3mg057_3004 [Herpetosiphonaceae bacterium]|nr:MAG: hypothetical protein KatS3mg057_3004 [Herpetosiphonaceae bacterium]
MQPNGLITLTTDFGTQDSYVAIMKGVILSILPHVRLVDYSHEIAPQNIMQAAYLLQIGYGYFPQGTVHLIVVDPGVGSKRRAIAVATPEAAFVAPDNGVLSLIWYDAVERWGRDRITAVELTEPRFWRPLVSATFHGRDIFAPVAAHLASGVSINEFGPQIDQIVLNDKVCPSIQPSGDLIARIIHVDRFGNCITNVTLDDLRAAGVGERLSVFILDQQISGLYRTYSDGPVGSPMALIGSGGYLELAVRNGHAAQMLGVGTGDTLRIRS